MFGGLLPLHLWMTQQQTPAAMHEQKLECRVAKVNRLHGQAGQHMADDQLSGFLVHICQCKPTLGITARLLVLGTLVLQLLLQRC